MAILEKGDTIFIYNETLDAIQSFEVDKINRLSYNVIREVSIGKIQSFPIQKDQENFEWFTDRAVIMGILLSKEIKRMKELKLELKECSDNLDKIRSL